MSKVAGVLAEWRKRMIAAEERCYWPGPRPVRDDERKEQLRGRDEDTVEIVNEIHTHGLTVLMGESGVGKSSLLDTLIRPRLAAEGFRVLVCHEWSSGGDIVDDIDEFVSRKVADQLPEGMMGAGSFAAQFDRRFGQRGVLILDQFEELIRHDPRLFKKVQDWIVDVVRRHDFHVVVSLRSEYEHRLRELRVDDYQRIDIYLEPISDVDHIREIVDAGRDEARPGDEIVAPEVVDEVCRLWSLAEGGHAWSGVGLLHLQALLYVLWSRASERQAPRIELTDLLHGRTGDLTANATDGRAESARAIFGLALSDAVHLRLDRGRSTYEEIQGRDEYLAEGVRSQIARMADHLTSGGYKVDQDRWHLARLVLEEELKTLEIDDDDDGSAAKIFSQFARVVDTETLDAEDLDTHDDESASDHPDGIDWITSDRATLVARLTVTKGQEPWDLDPNDVTSGPMMGLPPDHVFVEELRRFFFALEWLRVNSLIHLTTAGERTTVIALVHDGFGRGLRDWAERNDELAEQALTLLTAAIGETYAWKKTVIGGESAEKYRLIPNLRWRACRIAGVDFRHVVFMNCDFRESTFVDCSFHGATFVNCLLDGVTFRRSRILGNAEVGTVTPSVDSEVLPSFVVDDEETARVLRWYRDEADLVGSELQLVSESSGVPLVADKFPDDRKESDWTARAGGLVMYGGRLSSVMFATCTFDEASLLGLFNIAGTSLEFAEQNGGKIYLGGVAVRGLTISGQVGLDDALNETTKPTEVHVVNSILQNMWISTGLDGSADFVDSTAWQVFSASDSFEFSFERSPYYGLVNTGTPADTSFESKDLSMDGLGAAIVDLRKMSRKIDYRSSPASFDAQLVERRSSLPGSK